MSAHIDGNRIVIPIEIVTEDRREWQEIAQQAREIQNKTEAPRYEALDFAQEEYEQDPDFYDTLQQSIMDDVDEAVTKAAEAKAPLNLPELPGGAKKVLGMAGQSPESSFLQVVSLVAPQLAPILIASGVAKMLFDWYFSAGAPGDVRFKRDIPREVNNLFTRMEKQQRRLGRQQVIITSVDGFREMKGAFAGNSFKNIRDTGQANVGLTDKASGWRP